MPCSPRRRIRLVTVVSGWMACEGPVEHDMPPRTWRQQRASGPHGFAVRDPPSPKASADKPAETSGTGGNSAVRPARRCSLTETALRTNLRADAVASTTSHPAFVTIAKRPSWGMRWRELVALICPTAKAEYFFERDWTTQITLKSLRKLKFTRSGFFDPSSSSDADCRLICLVGQISSMRVLCGQETRSPSCIF